MPIRSDLLEHGGAVSGVAGSYVTSKSNMAVTSKIQDGADLKIQIGADLKIRRPYEAKTPFVCKPIQLLRKADISDVYTRIYPYTNICTCIHISACMYLHRQLYVYTLICICIHTFVSVYTPLYYICISIHTYISTHAFSCICIGQSVYA